MGRRVLRCACVSLCSVERYPIYTYRLQLKRTLDGKNRAVNNDLVGGQVGGSLERESSSLPVTRCPVTVSDKGGLSSLVRQVVQWQKNEASIIESGEDVDGEAGKRGHEWESQIGRQVEDHDDGSGAVGRNGVKVPPVKGGGIDAGGHLWSIETRFPRDIEGSAGAGLDGVGVDNSLRGQNGRDAERAEERKVTELHCERFEVSMGVTEKFDSTYIISL